MSDPDFHKERNSTYHVYSMSKTLISKIALRSRHHGAAYMLAVRQCRDFSATRNRPVLESVKIFARSGPKISSVASISETPSSTTPQYVPLTGLELFLAENPGLKPFLLGGPARERAVNESAIAWAEICDRGFHLIRGQIFTWHTGILGTMRSRMARWSGVKGSSNSKRCVKNDSLIDDNDSTPESQDGFATFDNPQSFVRECMPFFSVFGERVQEKSGYEIDLKDLRIKAEDEKIARVFGLSLFLFGIICELTLFLCFRIAMQTLPHDPNLSQFSYILGGKRNNTYHNNCFSKSETSGHEKEQARNNDKLLNQEIN